MTNSISQEEIGAEQQMTPDSVFMEAALELAKYSKSLGEVPVGAVVVYQDQIVGKGYNLREGQNNPLSHAELMAIHEASQGLNRWRLSDCDMFVTLEPCPMCAGAIVAARIRKLHFATRDPKGGGVVSLFEICNDSRTNHQVQLSEGLYQNEASKLLKEFFLDLRQNK